MSQASPQPTLRHLEQLTCQLLDGVIVIDPTGVILNANPSALRMHGVRTIEELGKTVEEYAERFKLMAEDHRPLVRREYPLFRLIAGESFPDLVVEVAFAGEDEARWIHQVRDVTLDEDGGDPAYLALVINDVSARFDAEARFNAMFGANPAPAIVVRLRDQRVQQANPGFLALTNFEIDQLEGKSLFSLGLLGELIDPASTNRSIEDGIVIPQTEAELLVADGSRRLVAFAGQPIDVTGEDAILLTFADLEPRRQIQAELAASERYLSAMFELAPVAMVVTHNQDHRIVSVNAAFRNLTGYTENEAIQHTADELRLWDNSEHRAIAEDAVDKHGGFANRDGRLSPKDGANIDCLVSAQTISVQGAPCVLWIYQDITERRRSELELIDAIDEVMKDASWLSRSIVDKIANLRRPGGPVESVALSQREREIIELICEDLDDAAIAAQLGLSRNTVRNHVARLYAKIGVNRRSGAVIWGRERGLGRRQR